MGARKIKSYLDYAPDRPAAMVVPLAGMNSKDQSHIAFDIQRIASMPEEDGGGYSEVIHLRVPPDCMRIIQIILEHEDAPFKTRSDVARAAMFYFFNCHPQGLRLAHTKEYRSLMRLTEISHRKRMREKMQQLVDEAYAWINDCNARRHGVEAKKSVQELLEAIMDMEPGEIRNGFLEHVKSTWGHLIQSCVVKAAVVGGSGSGDDDSEVEEYEGD